MTISPPPQSLRDLKTVCAPARTASILLGLDKNTLHLLIECPLQLPAINTILLVHIICFHSSRTQEQEKQTAALRELTPHAFRSFHLSNESYRYQLPHKGRDCGTGLGRKVNTRMSIPCPLHTITLKS